MNQQTKAAYHENRVERLLRTRYHRIHAAGYAPCVVPALFFTLSASVVLYALLGVWTAGIVWVVVSAVVLPLSSIAWALLYVSWRKYHQYLLSQDIWCHWCSRGATIRYMSILGG